MTAPPRECPCGRPRSGGTEITVAFRTKELNRVEYMHADGACIWAPLEAYRGPGRAFWYRHFNGDEGVITSASFA